MEYYNDYEHPNSRNAISKHILHRATGDVRWHSNENQIIYTTKINYIFYKLELEKKILSLYEKQKQYLLNKLFI